MQRANGKEIAFLQGDDALQFERELEKLEQINYPYGMLKSYEHALSIEIDQYDLERWG